ncbi:MAG: cell wall-associated NlpC family hydrolase [Planctomycetota bacterium]|jgi:cell wall-associated NlpC family hydrolase
MTRLAVLPLLLALLGSNVAVAQVSPVPTPANPAFTNEQAQQLLAGAKHRLAPDRRTSVFDVTAVLGAKGVTLTGEVHDQQLLQRLLTFYQAGCAVPVIDQLSALPDPTFGVVCVSVANLRSKPGHSQELGTQVLLGTPLRILKQAGGWSYVQAPNDYLCWTNDRMQRMDASEFATWRKQAKVIITDTFTTVLSQASAGSQAISDAVAGGLLSLEGERGEFYRVRYPDGRTGFVAKSAAMPFASWLTDTDDDPKHLIATARRFFGVPYLWGGTSTKGMDCSGFTSTVWFLNGVLLPRDASQQVHAGLAVAIDDAMSQVQPGDLLFFGRRATDNQRERVTHVGISLGGMRFIHASTDVHENSFDPAADDYSAGLKGSLLHVRRVIDQDANTGVRPLREHSLYQLR